MQSAPSNRSAWAESTAWLPPWWAGWASAMTVCLRLMRDETDVNDSSWTVVPDASSDLLYKWRRIARRWDRGPSKQPANRCLALGIAAQACFCMAKIRPKAWPLAQCPQSSTMIQFSVLASIHVGIRKLYHSATATIPVCMVLRSSNL